MRNSVTSSQFGDWSRGDARPICSPLLLSSSESLLSGDAIRFNSASDSGLVVVNKAKCFRLLNAGAAAANFIAFFFLGNLIRA